MTNYTATVYDRPGCMKCRMTERALTNMGIPLTTKPIDNDETALGIMADHGWQELPLVIIDGPEETFTWSGMSDNNLQALKYLTKD